MKHFASVSLGLALLLAHAPVAQAAQPNVVSTSPVANAEAAATDDIVVNFDTPLAPASVNSSTFRVFGKYSGTASGTFTFSNGNATVTFSPNDPFQAGEFVLVNLCRDIMAADTTFLRPEGYAFQFIVDTAVSGMVFQAIDEFSNTGGPQTRLYGAMAADLDNDDFVDLMTVNEVSADVRVFLNLGDGSGLFDTNWLTPQDVGVESSPNESADFDNDGNTDAAVSATDDHQVSILLGDGDGTFGSTQDVVYSNTNAQPHGIAVLDVDGDADLDIANAHRGGDEIALLINNGSGTFDAPTFFDTDVSGEYGLTAADMNGDGITDLVVGGIDSEEIQTMLGNGDGTFTGAAEQDSGGPTWVVVLGDLNGDGDLDAASANSFSGNIGVVLGNGDGTFGLPDTSINVGNHVPSVDIGDMDGDGDGDIFVSSFGGGFWRLFENDGSANFSFVEEFTAYAAPSCSILYDGDNDGDLDVALTDELAENNGDPNITILENGDGSTLCPPAPVACRTSEAGRSSLTLKDNDDPAKDRLLWKFGKGQTTLKADYGDPTVNGGEDYELCVYEAGVLKMNRLAPAGGTCAGKDCWTEKTTSYAYKDKGLTPDGIDQIKLNEGLSDGDTKIQVKGRGDNLDLLEPALIAGTLAVQLHQSSGGACWGTTFSMPFLKQDGQQLKAKSD